MSALFWLVVRWIAVVLIGLAVGSVAAERGLDSVAALIGAIAALVGGAFVLASILATDSPSRTRRTAEDTSDDLAGLGLWRAALLGLGGSASSSVL